MLCLVSLAHGPIVDKIKCCLISKSCSNSHANSISSTRTCNDTSQLLEYTHRHFVMIRCKLESYLYLHVLTQSMTEDQSQ